MLALLHQRKVRPIHLLLAAICLTGTAVGCGSSGDSESVSSGGTGGAGATGGSGGSSDAAAGSGGTAGTGGTAATGGSAGTAGSGGSSGADGGTDCTTSDDCPDGQICDPATGACVGCVEDSNCPLGSVCENDECVPGCNDAHGCAAGSVCCGLQCYDETDVSHCGGCDPCPEPAEAHAGAECNNGVCGFGPCDSGFADCNNDPTDGCETDLQGAAACPCVPGEQVDCYEGPPGTEGNGICVGGTKTCNADGIGYGECDGQVLPEAETCLDDLDNDCNGLVNDSGDGCTCVPGSTQACYTGPDGTRNVGQCADGTETCDPLGTAWGPCLGDVLPAAEDCALPGDENCDGQVNEAAAGCQCTPGATQDCYGGPAGTENVGLCVGGTQTCAANGEGWGTCVGQVLPGVESCLDDQDNDCNGIVNDSGVGCVCLPNATASCYSGEPTTEGIGACHAGTKTCNALGTAWEACLGEVIPVPESCLTAEDDNCDGQVNEGGTGCVCLPNEIGTCYSGPAGTVGVGYCVAGTQQCDDQGTSWGACVGEVVPVAETCLTPGDDNCNGQVNEGGAGCVCLPNATQSCYSGPAGTQGIGVCKAGVQTCATDGTSWGSCVGEVTPTTETCLTLDDDDCDGQVNESGAGCVCTPNATQPCYSGPAGTQNVGICVGGTQTCFANGTDWGPCVGEVTPKTESCATTADDDCNGSNLVCPSNQDCDLFTGQCIDPCDPALLVASYIGCEYYPTVTNNSLLNSVANPGGTGFHFAIAISNTGAQTVSYTITRGSAYSTTGTVAANSVAIVQLPWVADLRTAGASIVSTNTAGNGAYRLVSSRPVTVYQYNPIEYTTSGYFSYTNDASLLLPVNAWRSIYRVASRNTWSGIPGFYAVVASQDGTIVTLAPSATGGIVRAGGGVAANGTGTVTLNRGDVLQVLTGTGGGSPDIADLTGTGVTATKPVQIIGGHNCTDIPYNVTWCDHIEESIFPVETLSNSYVVSAPLIAVGTPKAQLVRVIATAPNTTLTYDPAQAGAPTTIAAAGGYVELAASTNNYRVTGSEKILVVQYMLGQAYGGGTGDPAMAQAVPVEQYRADYLFHAPTNYEANYVNVTAPSGTSVLLDGTAIPAGSFTVIGGTGQSFARVQLSNAGNGNHSISAANPVGISVYGYGQYTSYWYPGGLDLSIIN